jgi:hypothetical protein
MYRTIVVYQPIRLYRGPTALDAVAFAYISAAVKSPYPQIREDANKWVNLVAWEKKVRKLVTSAIHA